MKIEKKVLPLAELELNNGQIEGLPANPRQWTLTDVERLAASLNETPELLEMRCPIVVPHEGKFVVLGGNLRLAAARHNKDTEVACFVMEGATTEKMKEIVIKDNGSFGKWDWDSLANEWDSLPLEDWGVDVWTAEKEVEKVKKEEKMEGEIPFTEILNEEHNYIVLYFDNNVDWLQAETLFQIGAVKEFPTSAAKVQSEAFTKRVGVGRVLNGPKALETLRKNLEEQK